MKLLLIWSGNRSKAMAEALRDWLPHVIQAIKPWMSEHDMDKGARWSEELNRQLKECRVGLVCVTRDNQDSSWINFEAGVISASLEQAHVCPYLLDLKTSDLSGPLSQFQATEFSKEDTRKLLGTVNRSIEAGPISESLLKTSFDRCWPDLEENLSKIPSVNDNVEIERQDPASTGAAVLRKPQTGTSKTQQLDLSSFSHNLAKLNFRWGVERNSPHAAHEGAKAVLSEVFAFVVDTRPRLDPVEHADYVKVLDRAARDLKEAIDRPIGLGGATQELWDDGSKIIEELLALPKVIEPKA